MGKQDNVQESLLSCLLFICNTFRVSLLKQVMQVTNVFFGSLLYYLMTNPFLQPLMHAVVAIKCLVIMAPIVFKVWKMDKQYGMNLWRICLRKCLLFAAFFLSGTLKIYSELKIVAHVVLKFLARLIVYWFCVCPCFGEGAESLVPVFIVLKSLAFFWPVLIRLTWLRQKVIV